jgi:hypothetical protein
MDLVDTSAPGVACQYVLQIHRNLIKSVFCTYQGLSGTYYLPSAYPKKTPS